MRTITSRAFFSFVALSFAAIGCSGPSPFTKNNQTMPPASAMTSNTHTAPPPVNSLANNRPNSTAPPNNQNAMNQPMTGPMQPANNSMPANPMAGAAQLQPTANSQMPPAGPNNTNIASQYPPSAIPTAGVKSVDAMTKTSMPLPVMPNDIANTAASVPLPQAAPPVMDVPPASSPLPTLRPLPSQTNMPAPTALPARARPQD